MHHFIIEYINVVVLVVKIKYVPFHIKLFAPIPYVTKFVLACVHDKPSEDVYAYQDEPVQIVQIKHHKPN